MADALGRRRKEEMKMALVKGKTYTINSKPGYVYKFKLMPKGVAQYWFFHVDGFFNQALRENELALFVA